MSDKHTHNMFSVQLLTKKVLKITFKFKPKKHLTSKHTSHRVTQVFSVKLILEKVLSSMKSRNHIQSKHKACGMLATDNCSLMVKTGNGKFV